MIRLCLDFATVAGLRKPALQIRLQIRASLPFFGQAAPYLPTLRVVGLLIELL
jgi:hypothetical protein